MTPRIKGNNLEEFLYFLYLRDTGGRHKIFVLCAPTYNIESIGPTYNHLMIEIEKT